jgi:hypothetical protein
LEESPEEKGKATEKKVSKALENLQEKGMIKNFGQTFNFSKDDMYGVDFYIFPLVGKEIKIQVKSSWNKKKAQIYRKKGIRILCLWPNQTITDAEKKLCQIINNHTNHYQERKKKKNQLIINKK